MVVVNVVVVVVVDLMVTGAGGEGESDMASEPGAGGSGGEAAPAIDDKGGADAADVLVCGGEVGCMAADEAAYFGELEKPEPMV